MSEASKKRVNDPVSLFADAGPDADEARAQLFAASIELLERGASAHAEGMDLIRQSARLEQLAETMSDEHVLSLRDALLHAGVLKLLPRITGVGGDA